MCELIMDLIPNDSKHLLRNGTSQKSVFNCFFITTKNALGK